MRIVRRNWRRRWRTASTPTARPVCICRLPDETPPRPGELAEIRVALAHVAETGGRFDEVEELCDLAIEWFDGQSDERRALTLRRMRERARMELGQPARKTLEAMLVLDAEAKRLGFDQRTRGDSARDVADARPARRSANGGAHCERGRCHGGDDRRFRAAHRCAHPPWQRAAQRGTGQGVRDLLASAAFCREQDGDARRQALSVGNLGIAAQFESRLDEAIEAYGRAIAVARSGGMPDLLGARGAQSRRAVAEMRRL